MLSSRTSLSSKKKLNLQLTSLLDMFTIILVFLMVSFQAEDKDFVLNAGLKLPASSAGNPFKPAVNLAVTMDAVQVEGVQVYKLLKGGVVADKDFDTGRIEGVVQAVKQAWDNRKKEKDDENIVVIQADQSLPYKTIHLVMRSAAQSGFHRFRLVIEKE